MNVPVHKLAQWRDQANQALESAFCSRDTDPRDAHIRRLTSKIGQMTMEAELREEKIARLEGRPPFGHAEIEEMSQTLSPSANRPYGISRVCRV